MTFKIAFSAMRSMFISVLLLLLVTPGWSQAPAVQPPSAITVTISDTAIKTDPAVFTIFQYDVLHRPFLIHFKGLTKQNCTAIFTNSTLVFYQGSDSPVKHTLLDIYKLNASGLQGVANLPDSVDKLKGAPFDLGYNNQVGGLTKVVDSVLGMLSDGKKIKVNCLFAFQDASKGGSNGDADNPGNAANLEGISFLPTDDLQALWSKNAIYSAATMVALHPQSKAAIIYDMLPQSSGNAEKPITDKGMLLYIRSKRTYYVNNQNLELARRIIEVKKAVKRHLDTSDAELATQLKKIDDDLDKTYNKLSEKRYNARIKDESNDYRQALFQWNLVKERFGILDSVGYENFSQPIVANKSKGDETLFQTDRGVKHFSPSAGRNMLIAVVNYHPYRDSFNLAVSYDEKFLEDTALFSSRFSTANGLGTSSGTGAPTSKVVGDKQAFKPGQEQPTPLQLFTLLRDQLKQYYQQEVALDEVNLYAVEQTVNFIQARISDTLLSISQLTQDGFIQAATVMISKTKTDASDLVTYFDMVRDAFSWYAKVAGYRRYDVTNFQVQNHDDINIDFQHFRDGKLVTPAGLERSTYLIRGKWKMDFSAGVFVDFLVDKSFTTQSVNVSDTTFQVASNGVVNRSVITGIATAKKNKIIQDDMGNFNIGPAILSHFYYKSGREVNVGATFGLSLNQQASTRFLGGLSLLLGSNSRWVLTGGATAGQVKHLASGYSVGDYIDLTATNTSTVPTKDVWAVKWFASLTFNFAGFNLSSTKQ